MLELSQEVSGNGESTGRKEFTSCLMDTAHILVLFMAPLLIQGA